MPKLGAFSALAFSLDGLRLAAGTSAGWLYLFDVNPKLSDIGMTMVHSKGINSVAFSRNKKFIVTCSDDKTVVALTNSPDLTVLTKYESALAPVLVFDISPRNDQIIAAGVDTLLHLWATPLPEPITVIAAHTGTITAVQFTADAQHAITGSLDGLCRVVSLSRKSILRTYFWRSHPVTAMLVLPSERAFLAAYTGECPVVNLFRANHPSIATPRYVVNEGNDADLIAQYTGHQNGVAPMQICLAAEEVVVPSENGTIVAWSLHTQEIAWELPVGPPGIVRLALAADGALIAAVRTADRQVVLWARAG
jgi:WD40 repeat protein